MNNKLLITWEEVFKRLGEIDQSHHTIYGIPKGGMILCAFLNHADVTHDPGEATIFLDDVKDSGATFDYYNRKYPETPFHFLFDKNTEYSDKWLVFPWEAQHPMGADNVQQNIVRQLQYIGEDPLREGLKETPERIVRSWSELYSGYNQHPSSVLTVFSEGAENFDQIVLLKDIELFSMCEHHILPFFGKAHVAYIPNGKVIGVSKLARLVEIYARRLQIQERIGEQITNALMEHLKPLGAACIIEAQHMCMQMRGVSKQHSIMVTSSLKGAFFDKKEAREELMELIKK